MTKRIVQPLSYVCLWLMDAASAKNLLELLKLMSI